jgi:hypothetical protein
MPFPLSKAPPDARATAQGEAMDRDQASACTHIDEYLVTLAPEVT